MCGKLFPAFPKLFHQTLERIKRNIYPCAKHGLRLGLDRYESDLSNEVLSALVDQEAAKKSEVKAGGQ